jgi:hypothetical protein
MNHKFKLKTNDEKRISVTKFLVKSSLSEELRATNSNSQRTTNSKRTTKSEYLSQSFLSNQA